MDGNNIFKKGSSYTRQDVGWILLPETGRPNGGEWDTGYVRVDEKLIIFMNIGVPGKTNHDFDNYYDDNNKTIVWYGKPRSHSNQPTFQKLLNGDLIPYFFARWDNKNPAFTFLGIGKIVSYLDGAPVKDGKGKETTSIELKLTIEDSDFIIPNIVKNQSNTEVVKNESPIRSSFALEKHLESFIVNNWDNTSLNNKYDLYVHDGKIAQQFMTRSGPLDILAISKDKKEFLVIELKKDRASDVVAGQILRYMGHIEEKIATNGETVKGLIIALEEDLNLKDALIAAKKIDFLRYQIKFELLK